VYVFNPEVLLGWPTAENEAECFVMGTNGVDSCDQSLSFGGEVRHTGVSEEQLFYERKVIGVP